MIIALLAAILRIVAFGNYGAAEIPSVSIVTPVMHEAAEWAAYHEEAVIDYENEFDAIFNALSVTSKRTPKGLRVTVKRSNGKLARSYTVKAA